VIRLDKETIQLISITNEATVKDAVIALDKGALGIALIIDAVDRSFMGVITDGDIRRGLLKGMTLEDRVIDLPRPDSKYASIDDLPESITKQLSPKVRALPLLDKDRRVVDIAFYDKRVRIPVSEPSLGDKELEYVTDCILSNWVSSAGKYVEKFELDFAEFCGSQHAIAVSNGTAGLHLALLALGIGPGDEVIVPALTFIATANVVRYAGATPVFVDSTIDTWTMDYEQLESKISPRTRAIIPVHLYGHPANMEPILDIASQHGLFVVEDAAEAHGAEYQGKPVGTFGDVGCFSFYGNKIITTGEGGMVTTNDSSIASTLKRLRDHGMDPGRRYWHTVLGYNYRLTNLQAALGVAQLERVEGILQWKNEVDRIYRDSLSELSNKLTFQREAPWAKSAHWLFTILLKPEANSLSRDELIAALESQGIETRPVFVPLHQQPIYSTGERLPIAEFVSENGLSLPSSASLNHDEISRVVGAITAILND